MTLFHIQNLYTMPYFNRPMPQKKHLQCNPQNGLDLTIPLQVRYCMEAITYIKIKKKGNASPES